MALALVEGGVAREVPLGQPFETADGTQYPPSVLDLWPAEDLAAIGVLPIVEPAATPAGQFIASVSLDVVDGVPTRVATFADQPLDQLKAAKAAAAQTEFETRFSAGYFPASGSLAGQSLQVRNLEDRTNWLTSQAAYAAAVSAGMGATEGATFRTTANLNFTLTYGEGLQVLLDMAAWGSAMYRRLWALKDAATAATSAADLDAIDVGADWP